MLCYGTESPFYEDGCIQSLLWWSERPEAQFLGTSYKTPSQRSQISPKRKLFSHHSSAQSTQSDDISIIYHNKYIWDSLILLIKLFNEKWSRWYDTSEFESSIKKSISKLHSFSSFYSASILNVKQLNTPSVSLISLNLLFHQPSTSILLLINH